MRGGYVDRYGAGLLILLTLLLGLNVLDALFTLIILDYGGNEANPIVRWAIDAWGEDFWLWKFALVSANAVLLCMHSRFRHVEKLLLGAALIYLAVVFYEVVLLASS